MYDWLVWIPLDHNIAKDLWASDRPFSDSITSYIDIIGDMLRHDAVMAVTGMS